ncbi:MAG: hypothetical protein WBN61_08510 [Woeseiaceae bacterium]
MDTNEPRREDNPDRWTLLRDVGVLQVKLLIDGLRDLLLVPASLIAGIISLVSSADGKPGPEFYRLLAAGKKSEHWINLFGAVEHCSEAAADAAEYGNRDIDSLVRNLETYVVDEYKRGGVTAQAKDKIDKALDAIQRNTKKPL